MKHFPKPIGYLVDCGSSTVLPLYTLPRKTVLLALAVAFAAGACAATYICLAIIW